MNPSMKTGRELREAQTLTLDKLKNVGEAVVIDVGEGRDIHPRNKPNRCQSSLDMFLVKELQATTSLIRAHDSKDPPNQSEME